MKGNFLHSNFKMTGALSKFLFSYDTLTRAVAGSTGSVVAMTVFYPLDVVRSRLQVEEQDSNSSWRLMMEIMNEEGLSTLYKGIGPVLQSLWVSNFIFFYVFHGLKYKNSLKERTMARDLLYGTIAGIINVLVTTPLWVVTTRMKTQGMRTRGTMTEGIRIIPPVMEGVRFRRAITEEMRNEQNRRYKSLLDGLVKITNREGAATLWSSTVPSLILVANPAIYVMLYEYIKRKLETPDRPLGSKSYFLIAAFCKTITSILTYPLQLVQTKFRHGHTYRDLPRNAGMVEVLSYIIRKKGFIGLFKGVETKIIQTVLTAALMYTTYEKIAALVFGLMRPKHMYKK